jgi:general transcription factor 3C polypeptide 3 (transcription factor C subunit 4)
LHLTFLLSLLNYTVIACAICDQRSPIAVEQIRKLINLHQFNNEPQRILLAALSSGLRPTDAFITSTLQKHLFREMKLADAAVKNPETLKWNPLNKRYAPTGGSAASKNETGEQDDEGEEPEQPPPTSTEKDQDRKAEIPTKFNPIPVTVYGQVCTAAKSYQSAICRHAFTPVQRDLADVCSKFTYCTLSITALKTP